MGGCHVCQRKGGACHGCRRRGGGISNPPPVTRMTTLTPPVTIGVVGGVVGGVGGVVGVIGGVGGVIRGMEDIKGGVHTLEMDAGVEGV